MSQRADETIAARFAVKTLHPALGAEVRGLDMQAPLAGAAFRELHDLWMRHLVLVFPEQHVTDGEHVAFTRHFGEPEIFHQQIIRSQRVPEVFRVSNVDDDGNLMPPEHPTVQQVSLAQLWHTDSSYRTIPCTGALLHGVEVSRTGGETQFTNMYVVYDALPDSLRRQVEGRKARHNFGNLHTLRDSEAPDRGRAAGHAAGLAADGAPASRHRAQVPLHQSDLQRRGRGHEPRRGEAADRGSDRRSPRKPASSIATDGRPTTCSCGTTAVPCTPSRRTIPGNAG